MDVESLCNGNWDRPLRLAVLEYRKKAPGLLLGECETTLRTILNTQRDTHSTRSAEDASMHGFELRRDMTQLKPIGRLQVRLAQVMDIFNRAATDCTSIIDDDSSTELDDIDVFAPSTPLAKLPTAIAALPTPMAAPATFQDYIKSGWRLDFYVAIDLTSSNGDPRIPGTLHYQNPTALNDYEETIVSIGTAIAPYTVGESMATTVWGFGCKFDGVVRHIFQCGSENPVYGVDGILRAYKAVFMSDLTMSGPTCLDQVLQAAAVQARKHQQAQVPVYSVLLIITDGISQDLQETKRKMEMYSSLPLSVLIVGVGRADFGSMHELASFSNVTVCEFRQHQHDPRSLGKGVLKHLPGQILQYMRRNKISSRRS